MSGIGLAESENMINQMASFTFSNNPHIVDGSFQYLKGFDSFGRTIGRIGRRYSENLRYLQ